MRRIIILIPILALAFFMAFIPHLGYAYPVHVDEWMHLTYSETIVQAGSTTFPDPFTGQGTIGVGSNAWVGFHILWAIVQQVSGISWLPLFRYFPALIFLLTVLSVYILASRQGFGWQAALFTCLIPTTGGLLGPAFMVPMALGLLFIPLALFLAFNIKSWASYLLILLITCFLLLLHPPTAAILVIILLPYILISIKGDTRHSAAVFSALLIPFLLALLLKSGAILQYAGKLLVPQYTSPHIELPPLLWIYGVLPIIFSLIGIIFLARKGGKQNFSLIFGLALLLIIMLVFMELHYGLATIYQRGLTTVLLILSLIAGAGLFWVKTLTLPTQLLHKSKSVFSGKFGNILCGVLVIIVLAVALPSRLNAYYYHMIDLEDYQAFVWIKEHVGVDYSAALVDPWKATAFTAITGKKVARRIWEKQEAIDDIIYRFLQNECPDTSFLIDNRVSFIYNRMPCSNPDLIEVSKDVYLTNPNISEAFVSKDGLQNASFEYIYGKPPAFWWHWSQNCQPLFLFPEPGRNGGSCIAIQMSETEPFQPSPSAIWLQNVPVQEGRSYIIGGWINTETIIGQGGARIVSQWKGPGNKWIGATEFMKYVKGTNSWTHYQGKVTAPPGATICTVGCSMAGCSGTAWYDDISFQAE